MIFFHLKSLLFIHISPRLAAAADQQVPRVVPGLRLTHRHLRSSRPICLTCFFEKKDHIHSAPSFSSYDPNEQASSSKRPCLHGPMWYVPLALTRTYAWSDLVTTLYVMVVWKCQYIHAVLAQVNITFLVATIPNEFRPRCGNTSEWCGMPYVRSVLEQQRPCGPIEFSPAFVTAYSVLEEHKRKTLAGSPGWGLGR